MNQDVCGSEKMETVSPDDLFDKASMERKREPRKQLEEAMD